MKTIYKITLFLASAILLASCGSQTKEAAATEEHQHEEGRIEFTQAQFKRSGIEFGKVEMKNLSSTIAVNGALDVPPQNMVSVSALMGGFIKSTELLQGMQVKKGQVIATIQNPDFIQIQSQYLEGKQKLKFLELEYKRQEELSKENVAAAKTFQQASSEYNSLLATLGALEEKLRILNIDPTTLTQSNIRSTVNIYAPIGGYVTVVNVNIGRFVNPQDVICEIVDTDHLHAELTVFEKDISKLKKGQKVRFVLVNESNKERTATIFLINHKISEERTIRVHAHLDSEDPALMPNMYLKAVIEVGDNKTTALPDVAIVNAGSKNYIFIKDDGHGHDHEEEKNAEENVFKAIEIQKGVSQNGYTEVILPEGFETDHAEVVTKGAYDL
ncbi:MAG: efflux RND transporter periplasmic adaptor subunit, partial [Cytophagales bacterium]|nr:efflux RND transporter periplasmic adaptor subunit [Cytophagales bacterium]